MCGIVGVIAPQSRQQLLPLITRATRALTHRGPDDEGIEVLTGETDALTVAFGQRRLSILDLSPAGHQPMRDDATGNS